MTSPSLTQSLASTPPVITDRQILFHLIRQEWRLCRGLVIPLAMIWVIGLWVLVIFSHPAWLLVLGLLHVMLISPNQAGRDIMDGTEEFSFALPSGRSPLYLARLAPGLIFLLANGLLGSLAIACNLPQCVWAMAFSGGLTEPFAPVTGAHWYAMSVLWPLAAHAITFALAANAGSRAGVYPLSWLAGITASGLMMLAGFLVENLLWGGPNGFLAGPALLVTTVLVLLAGHHAYLRKEASGVSGKTRSSWIFWIIAVILALLVFAILNLFLVRQVRAVTQEKQRAQMERDVIPMPPTSPPAAPEPEHP
jgi:uncharacterized membrane protein